MNKFVKVFSVIDEKSSVKMAERPYAKPDFVFLKDTTSSPRFLFKKEWGWTFCIVKPEKSTKNGKSFQSWLAKLQWL